MAPQTGGSMALRGVGDMVGVTGTQGRARKAEVTQKPHAAAGKVSPPCQHGDSHHHLVAEIGGLRGVEDPNVTVSRAR